MSAQWVSHEGHDQQDGYPMKNRIFFPLFSLLAGLWAAMPARSQEMDRNYDRPGSNIKQFELLMNDPMLCAKACRNNGRCKAWTFIKAHSTHGPHPFCQLKGSIPTLRRNNGCISGVKKNLPATMGLLEGMEKDTDRPGKNIRNFSLKHPDPQLCQVACLHNLYCQSWTYVKPNTSHGPLPRCFIKYKSPDPKPDACCVSGLRLKTKVHENMGGKEPSTSRPGANFKTIKLQEANSTLCLKACARNLRCKAWTYRSPKAISGDPPLCHLKYQVPHKKTDSCCTSGTKKKSF
jgi:hypothetical protein